jgi:hypothetical protein
VPETHRGYGRSSVFKVTADEWYPSYQLTRYHDGIYQQRLVEVSFVPLISSGGGYRVCAWGGDDFGLERDYPQEDAMEAWEMYVKVIEQAVVNVIFLEQNGFRRA